MLRLEAIKTLISILITLVYVELRRFTTIHGLNLFVYELGQWVFKGLARDVYFYRSEVRLFLFNHNYFIKGGQLSKWRWQGDLTKRKHFKTRDYVIHNHKSLKRNQICSHAGSCEFDHTHQLYFFHIIWTMTFDQGLTDFGSQVYIYIHIYMCACVATATQTYR